VTTWLFEPPTVEITHSINNGYIDSERFGVRFKTNLGVTVYRINGTWHSMTSPPPDQWGLADLVFWGGHTYIVDDEIHDELVEAGLWNGGSTGIGDTFTDIFTDTFGDTGSGSSDDFAGAFSDTF
jgi:hypothetical protein